MKQLALADLVSMHDEYNIFYHRTLPLLVIFANHSESYLVLSSQHYKDNAWQIPLELNGQLPVINQFVRIYDGTDNLLVLASYFLGRATLHDIKNILPEYTGIILEHSRYIVYDCTLPNIKMKSIPRHTVIINDDTSHYDKVPYFQLYHKQDIPFYSNVQYEISESRRRLQELKNLHDQSVYNEYGVYKT